MNEKQATWNWLNGFGVVYKKHLCQIREVHEGQETCDLVRLTTNELIHNVSLKEIVLESEYDWEDDDGRS